MAPFLVLLVLSGFVGSASGREPILVEAEQYTRSDSTLMPPFISPRAAASNGRMAAVRGKETGGVNWLEYEVKTPGGLYELFLRAGGNNSRQACLVSIDGGKPVVVRDDPPNSFPLGGPPPADFRARSKLLEETFRVHRVGSVKLSPGAHRFRVQHAGEPGRSNSFGFDWLKLVPVSASDAPRIEVGDHPEPEGGRRTPTRQPLEVRLLTSYRFWGPDEHPRIGLLVFNRAVSSPVTGTVNVQLRAADTGRLVKTVWHAQVTGLRRRECYARLLDADRLRARPGVYRLNAALQTRDGQSAQAATEIVFAALNTPAWAKRARVKFVSYRFGANLKDTLAQVRRLADQGINTFVKSGGGNFGLEGVSYPWTGGDDTYRQLLDTVHEVGGRLLAYRSMITVSEHFYFEHRSYWNGRKPYYHCSWLSAYPGSPQWIRHHARDIEFFVRRYPLDGIFLDNASASGWPEARTQQGEQAVARHQAAVRAAIRRANPLGVLYPNYNVLSPPGLRTVARAWDAHMLEGFHPVPKGQVQGQGWPVRRFVEVAGRVRRLTGKPFWPLLYTPGRYQRLAIAACATAHCNPCGPVDRRYLRFLHDLDELLYADDVFPAPPDTVRVASDDPDLAATALVKFYREAGDSRRSASAPLAWVIQIVNGAEKNGKPARRRVDLLLDLPTTATRTGGWLLRPESSRAEKIAVKDRLTLDVGVWAVVVVAETLPPKVHLSPRLFAPVPGERRSLDVHLATWTGAPVHARARLLVPAGWPQPEEVPLRPDGTARLTLLPPPAAAPGNRELIVRVTWRPGEDDGPAARAARISEAPVVARVVPRLDVSLRPDHFPVRNNMSAAAKLVLVNHTGKTLSGVVTFDAPTGWRFQPDRAPFSVAGGDTATLPGRVTWPRFEPKSLYDLRDAPITLHVETGNGRFQTTETLRLHLPVTWCIYCPLGTRPKDVVRTGATPGGGMLSDVLLTIRGSRCIDDPLRALAEARRRQASGEQRVVVWFRTGQKGSDRLADPRVAAAMAEFMRAGGAVILQENVFRDSPANRALLSSDVCPIGAPYTVTDVPGGDWRAAAPVHPAVVRFVQLARLGKRSFGIPQKAQPRVVTFTVKPWAAVAARNGHGDPVVVVSTDPARPVAYLAGSLEGTYMDHRFGCREYPDQMAHLLYFYEELARWLTVRLARG